MSNKSDNSDVRTEGRRSRTKASEQDLELKLKVAGTLGACGYVCKTNVILSTVKKGGLSDVTDVDVVAIRHDVSFSPFIVGVSCKSGRRVNPATEIFHLRGVLDYLGANEGYFCSARRPLDAHVRELSRQLDIVSLARTEIDHWIACLIKDKPYPGYFDSGAYGKLLKAREKSSTSGDLEKFLQREFWYNRDFRNIQNLLAYFRNLKGKPSGREQWHAVMVLEATLHFSLSVLQLCRHVRLIGTENVVDTVSSYIFGGVATYKSRRDLHNKVRDLLERTGTVTQGGPTLPSIEPGYTKQLAEIAFRMVERPQAAIAVPLVIQDEMWRCLGATGLKETEDKEVLIARKFAGDLVRFVANAGQLDWAPEI